MNIKRSSADIARDIAAAMNPEDLIIAVKNGKAKHPVIDQLMIAGRKRAVKVRTVSAKTATPRSIASMTKRFSAPPVSVSTFDDNTGLEIDLSGTKVKINRRALLPKGVDPVQLVALIRELADDPELTTERFLKAGFDLQTDGSWVVGGSFLELLQRIYAEAEATALVKQAA